MYILGCFIGGAGGAAAFWVLTYLVLRLG